MIELGKKMKCLNVIVLYENADEVVNYVKEVSGIGDSFVDIVIVVNSDKNNERQSIIDIFNQCNIHNYRIIDYGENIGYLNSFLFTIRDLSLDEYEYYILSNTDIHYEQISFFESLQKKEYDNQIGCIAPSVYSKNTNSYSNPHYLARIPKKKYIRLSWIFAHPFWGRVYLKLAGLKSNTSKSEKKQSCFVYSPHGCYMIFTQKFVRCLKGYIYGVKMYSEEACIGEQLLRNKMKCFYDSDIEVIHDESTVTGKMDYKKRFAAWKESIDYILKEFYE